MKRKLKLAVIALIVGVFVTAAYAASIRVYCWCPDKSGSSLRRTYDITPDDCETAKEMAWSHYMEEVLKKYNYSDEKIEEYGCKCECKKKK